MSVNTTTTKPAKPATKPASAKVETPVQSPEFTKALASTKASVKVYETKMKARETATMKALVAKVESCREIITLMGFPETFAARGPKAGKPSVTIIAELLGYPRQSFTPLFQGAEKLAEYYATLPAETVATIFKDGTAPTEAETDLASVGLVSEAERSRANRLKAKTASTAPASTGTAGDDTDTDTDPDGDTGTAVRTAETIVPTYDAVVSATLALQSIVAGYCRDAGFSKVQAENLSDTLAEISALIDTHKVDGGDA